MLKKALLFGLTLFVTFGMQAQTADEIINNYFENTGGAEAWRQLESTKMTAKMSMQGMEFPGTIYAAPPNKQRAEINVQGQEIISAYNGDVAWMINPMMGSGDPQKMPDAQAEEMKKQEFESPLLDYEKKGHTVSLEGKETVDGTETYKVKLTRKNGDVEYYYFEPEYYVPIMMEREISNGQMKGQMAKTYLSDYQEVEGLMMPFFIESKINGQTLQKLTITSVELNPEIETEMFNFPKQ